MGFYLLDVGQYKGDVLKATTHTLILHVWPMLMVHTELARFHSDLQQMYVYQDVVEKPDRSSCS